MGKAFPSNPLGIRRNAKTSTSSNQMCFIGETIAVTATQAGTINTLMGSCYLPKGAEIVGIVLDTDTLDSNVSKTITLSIGDAGSAARLLAANTVGQAGGVVTTPSKGAIGYQYTAETLIQVKVAAAAATGAAGTLKYGVYYVTN